MSIIRRLILAACLMAGLTPAFAQAPAPVPALPDTERRTSYSISGTTCACAVGFALYGDSTDYQNWVEVWINGQQATFNDPARGWTITSPSGSLATLSRPITDAVLTFTSTQTGTIQIVGARRPRRTSQVAENRGVAARDFNQTITDLVAQNREVWDKINDVTGRAVLAPPGETLKVLAAAASRANLGACFDSGGNLVSCASVPSTTIAAGNGILFTGTNPTTITNNIAGGAPITVTGTNPLTIGCPTCGNGNVINSGTPTNHQTPVWTDATHVKGIGPGTAGQQLTSNGASADPSYQSGGWVLLNTLTAANSATLTDTTSITSTYSEYEVLIENMLCASASQSLLLQINSGGVFQNTGYNTQAISGTGAAVSASTTTNGILAMNAASCPTSGVGVYTRFHASYAGGSTVLVFHGTFEQSGLAVGGMVGGSYPNLGAIGGIRLLAGSGNLTSGIMKIYGRL